MSPLVQEMLNTVAGHVFLEGLLEDDCKCESSHIWGSISCTHIAVARKKGCTLEFNICQSSYEWNIRVIRDAIMRCDTCGENVADCWTIRPI